MKKEEVKYKKRDKIFFIVIILALVVATMVVIGFYLSQKNIIGFEKNETDKVNLNEQAVDEIFVAQKEAKRKYPNFKWVSDGNLGKIEAGVENGKVYIVLKEDGSKTYLNFDKGTPKYAAAVLKGGMLKEVLVITTDGALYIANCDGYGSEGFEYKFELLNLGEKVVDATYANGSDMYYLLQGGKLVTKDLVEYTSFETKALAVQKAAKEKYPNFKWVSNEKLGKIESGVENGKVYIVLKEDGSKTYLNFDKGTPKYAATVLRGGMLKEIFVITTDGNLYIADCDGYGREEFEYKFELLNLGKKVVDATYANGSDMYYLLQNGKLVTKDLAEYTSFEIKALAVQKAAKEKYPNFKWVSNEKLGKIESGVENGKVYIVLKEDGSKTYLNFDKGTPKYAATVLRGGMLKEIFVITTDGNLYIANCDGYGSEGFEYKFEFLNLGEKVVDATYANGSDMYYLLQNGKLSNKNGTFAQ